MTIFIIFRRWADLSQSNYLVTTDKDKAVQFFKKFREEYRDGTPDVEIWDNEEQVFGGPVHDEFWTVI